jgi:hypothetical protein
MASTRKLEDYVPGLRIEVSDKMQTGYGYLLAAPVGREFCEKFSPWMTPPAMLSLGVFEGKYLNDCRGEFPREWYQDACERLSATPNPRLNCFGLKSRQSLQVWKAKGWIPAVEGDPDIRGWFQWYCRYYLGRRLPAADKVQIARWRSFARHRGQIVASYARMDSPPQSIAEKKTHRPKQRQALLQWAYDPWV